MSSHINISRCLVFLALSALGGHALTLEELEKSYEQKQSEVRLEKDKSLAALNDSYLGALARIEAKYQKAGRLDEVMLTREEIKDLTAEKWPLKELPEKISLEVAAPRKIYLQKRIEIEQQAARKRTDTADKMLALLDKQAVDLTKEGNLQQALLARQIKAEIESDTELGGARKLLGNVLSDGKSRPALRIRRFGDNIEVLVSYDVRGKISMDSPVANVQETDKSIGDTKAKVLGEFVGAKGYEVDPYIIYAKSLEDDDLGNFKFHPGLGVIPKHVEAGEVGLMLAYDPNSTNSDGGIWHPDEPKAGKGTTRLRFRYFIPKSNRYIDSVRFSSLSGSIIRTDGAKRGKWFDMEVTSASVEGKSPCLVRIYLVQGSDLDKQEGGDDYVVVKNITYELIKFTAYVTQRIGDQSVLMEAYDDPSTQPVLVSNGELIPQTDP